MRAEVDGPAAARALRDALPSLLVLANCPTLDGLNPYPPGSADRVVGREHGPAGFHLPGRKPKERLIVGRDGLTISLTPEEWLTVRYADVVACVHEPPDVRVLLGRDGMRVGIEPHVWKDGARVVEEVDRKVPQALVACAEHGIGGLEDPEAEPVHPAHG
jgi:hypothetical protein